VNVALLTGGASSERDVALATGLQVAGALRERGHAVATVDLATGFITPGNESALLPGGVGREPPSLTSLRELQRGMLTGGLGEIPVVRDADVVFVALHGGQGENGTVQALLDVVGVPYTGSGHLASALAMDKDLSKHVLRDAGITVPRWVMTPAAPDVVAREVGFPCIVKPSNEGSSVGLSLVREPAALPAAIAAAAAAFAAFAVVPFGAETTLFGLLDQPIELGVADVNVALLVIFAITSMGIYGIVLAGWWLALGHLLTALLLAITLIGIPFAWAHLKLAGLALWPIGKDIVSTN